MTGILTTTTSVSASIIAVCALVLTFQGWRDKRVKIRLDLFNRRFAIYQRVLVLYQELIVWEDREDQKALIQPFIEASREALFIFPRKSGVYEYIQEFWEHTWRIANFKEASQPLRDCGMNQELAKLINERTDHVNWILSSMTKLEGLMKDSMSFERL
jgi:hypothetical protein